MSRTRRITLFTALWAVPLAQATPAQELVVLPVGEALSDRDADRIPDRLGELVVLSGVLTTDPYPGVQATESRAYLQDSSGGIRLVTYDLTGLAGLERGDSVRAVGTIGQYYGMEVLELDTVERFGSGMVPIPRLVTANDLLA